MTKPTLIALALVCFVSRAPLHGQDGSSDQHKDDPRLRSAVLPLVDQHDGEVALAIEHLDSGISYRVNEEKVMPTASLIKLPLMIATYRAAEQATEEEEQGGAGQGSAGAPDAAKAQENADSQDNDLDLDRPIELRDDDKVPGSGVLRNHFSHGARLSLRDYVRLMMRYSDNTATNIVIDQVGLQTTSDLMETLGLENTKLHSKLYRRGTSIFPQRSAQYGIGSTTAAEMVRLLGMLHRGELASQNATAEMFDHLLACDDDTKLAAQLPSGVKIAHKSGAITRSRTAAGIIYTATGPVAVCVLTSQNNDRSWSDDNEAHVLCARIGKIIVQRFGIDPQSQTDVRRGTSGRLVESLQRTLNHRLEPSPELAVDGDFGPVTETAVRRFQRQMKVDASGIVGPATWKALGTLIEKDDPVPDPDTVMSEVLPIESPPALSDPPIVTCKAWAIADQDGRLLWDFNAQSKLEAASTTKIMTAVVVLDLASEDPTVLDEIITFSERADNTLGSTSGIRAGEKVSARQLLHGLLLPSGNDASVALAEHFGSRLRKDGSDETPYQAFIVAMNQKAQRLGMANAHYVNPHGLSDPDHTISARDLLSLAMTAMRDSTFRTIVATRQFGCRVDSLQGYQRNVLWKNTNQLLAIDGYSGIKTGTTGAAGACLVSRGQRDGRELTMVVLGSSSSPARYADTRNLFRWAWRQLELTDGQDSAAPRE